MASMSIAKTAIFHLSKVFSHSQGSDHHKPFRLFFVSGSNYSDWRNAAEGTRDSRDDHWDRNIEMSGKAKDTMREGMDVAKDQAKEMKDRTKGYGHEAKEYAYDTKETAKKAAGAVADETKQGVYLAAETVKGAWGMAKETTQKIKETVVGKDDREKVMDEDVVELRRKADKSKE